MSSTSCRADQQRGILYDTLVNTVRSQIPNRTEFIHAKVTDIATGPERQTVKLSNGEEIAARLVVLATGLNIGTATEARHRPRGHQPRPFDLDRLRHPAGRTGRRSRSPSLTYFTERPADRMAYITLFPIGATMRANLFAYRDLHDPWLKQFRDAPQETLCCDVAGAARIDGRLHGAGLRSDPAGRSLRHQGLPAERRRAGRRCFFIVLPRRRHRRPQGAGRRRAALQCPHPALARDPGHGRGENRRLL